MGIKTKIDWCESTWNPITGCKNGCEYCYAAKYAKRLIGDWSDKYDISGIHPREFSEVRFHLYRLKQPQHWKKRRNIFVCSMADMFGDWIPDELIKKIFDACEAAPQHRYLFLTKNPRRYTELYKKDILSRNENFWFGTTVTSRETEFWYNREHPHFISIEPITDDYGEYPCALDTLWVIIGAETGNRKGKVIPKREWIETIVQRCRENEIPVFMKNSLAKIWGEPLIQEFPWETV